MKKLKGKVAVVTGAAGGIGLAMVRAFTAEGMQVVMAGIDAERLARAADEFLNKGGGCYRHGGGRVQGGPGGGVGG